MAEINTAEIDAALVLNVSGLSPQRQLALIRAFGAADKALGATDAELSALEGFTAAHIARLRRAIADTDIAALRAQCRQHQVQPVPYTSPQYPALLRETEDAAPMLYVQGTLQRRDDLAVALVGTRKCTAHGLTMARRLSEGLARRGFTIVSGMALGIDGEAHRAALEAGGRTIAVMASGPDITYPADHRALREAIAAAGAVVTEFSFGVEPLRERFPARNRLISGLSMGVVVVEAPAKSGALITARLAAEQGREVFAVPGDVTRAESRGGNALIKDGARLVEFPEDVVEGLGVMLQAVPERQPVATDDLPQDERAIVDALSHQPRHVDEIVARCGLAASAVTAGLMILEMKGIVRRLPGSTFVRL